MCVVVVVCQAKVGGACSSLLVCACLCTVYGWGRLLDFPFFEGFVVCVSRASMWKRAVRPCLHLFAGPTCAQLMQPLNVRHAASSHSLYARCSMLSVTAQGFVKVFVLFCCRGCHTACLSPCVWTGVWVSCMTPLQRMLVQNAPAPGVGSHWRRQDVVCVCYPQEPGSIFCLVLNRCLTCSRHMHVCMHTCLQDASRQSQQGVKHDSSIMGVSSRAEVPLGVPKQ